MTYTKPDVTERVPQTLPPRRRRMWPWVLVVVVVVAAGVLGAVLLWPDGGGDKSPVLTGDPPYGLTSIDMPDSEEELVAALERMPVIDGRQPTVTRQEGLVTVVYEGTALPEGWWSLVVGLDLEVDAEWFIDGLRQEIVDAEEEGRIVEASALDPNGDLVWQVVTDPDIGDGVGTFRMTWADPADLGPGYTVIGDTADFRLKLVHAFITAVGG